LLFFASHHHDDVDALNLVLIQVGLKQQVGFSFIIFVCMYLSYCFSFSVFFFSGQILEV
jgi:hypothetical protein